MFIKAVSFAVLLFAGVVAYMVGVRIDQSTIQLLSGTLIGILVATPCTALATWILVKRRDDNRGYTPQRATYNFLPENRQYPMPQMWGTPQLQQPYQMPPMLQPPAARKHFVIGDDGSMSEL